MIEFSQSCMYDECTDSSNREQLVIYLHWVDNCLEVHEDLIGLYSIPDITAGIILGVIKDTISRTNLDVTRISRKHCLRDIRVTSR